MAEKTRIRNGKLERLDPVTGIWVVHPLQMEKEEPGLFESVFSEMAKDDERIRQELLQKKEAERFLKTAVHPEEYLDNVKPDEISISKVIDANVSSSFKTNKTEVIADVKIKGRTRRYIMGCSSYSGDFYEPPDEECWFDPLDETIKAIEERVKRYSTTDEVYRLKQLKKYKR